MRKYRILVINPGSTSTKAAVYEGRELVMECTLRHGSEELARFENITEQFEYRKELILQALRNSGIDIKSLDAVIGRGGLLKPIPSGVYEVNEAMRNDLASGKYGEHASNLGGLIAYDIASGIGVKAYIADPVVVDEMQDVAHLSGHPSLPRLSIFHALNQKAVARNYASREGVSYDSLNLIIAHLGGGISVGVHRKGKVVDVNNALDGEGPFSPERAGTLPAGQLIRLCLNGKYDEKELLSMTTGCGGLVAHLGTNSVPEAIERAAAGDEQSRLVIDAMCYTIAKSIGAAAAVLCGDVDAIILTGGIAYNASVCEYIRRMVAFIAPVTVVPGENELEALAENALLVLEGDVEPSVYN